MKKSHHLQFCCHKCHNPIHFSVFDLDQKKMIGCTTCNIAYDFNDETLMRQLRLFEALCRQIRLSEEILSCTCVGISVGDREIKVPYKLLLTRLNSTLDLTVAGKPLSISFRIEPAQDMSIEKEA